MSASAVSDEISKLWRVRKTMHEMLRDRGYNVEEGDLKMTVEEFRETFGNE